jgi:hypothetical protein
VGGGGVEGCERAEDAFGHGGAADVAEADEEDGDFLLGGGVGHLFLGCGCGCGCCYVEWVFGFGMVMAGFELFSVQDLDRLLRLR